MKKEHGEQLLRIARVAIAKRLGCAEAEIDPGEVAAELEEPGAAFVTLTVGGQLRGCIGSLEAWRPLAEDVEANACAAAFEDPRFPPLDMDEWRRVKMEISVLTPPEEIAAGTEEEVLETICPGRDGVILNAGGRCGTFLPSVWEQIPDKRTFLAQLKCKAGWPIAGWPAGARVFRYQAEKIFDF